MKNAFCLLCLLLCVALCLGGTTFLRSYEHPGEVITKVTTLKLNYNNVFMALEGYYPQTGDFFSRIQCVDVNGNTSESYSSAYAGEPLHLSSGLFTPTYMMYGNPLLTPFLEELPLNQFRFRWSYGYTDSTVLHDEAMYLLPDSLDTVVDFPTAINSYISLVFGSWGYQVTGSAYFNGIYRCFVLDVESHGSEGWPLAYLPGLQRVSGIARFFYSYPPLYESGYIAVGQANGWTGKIIRIDNNSNVLWQQNFTDGCDATQTPVFNTPLLISSPGRYPMGLSYQKKDRVLHIDGIADDSLHSIYTEQLDGYVEAIPAVMTDSLVTFAYVKNGVQTLKQVDFAGNVKWVCVLPGIGSFGKNSLSGFYTDYLIAGKLPGDGYYLARVDGSNGSISYDEISQPDKLKLSSYPNPCDDVLQVSFELKQPGKVKLEIFNLKGQRLTTLKNTAYPKGIYTETFSLKSVTGHYLPSGVYLLRLDQNGKHITKKLLFQN